MKITRITYTQDMVKARRAGNKTNTRRVMSPQPEYRESHALVGHYGHWWKGWNLDHRAFSVESLYDDCPYGRPGDRLLVCEALCRDDYGNTRYKADGDLVIVDDERLPWRWKLKVLPSLFMPTIACRSQDELIEVRLERVQDISEEDARAEGVGDWYPSSLFGKGNWCRPAGPKAHMDKKLKADALKVAMSESNAMLKEHWDEIQEAFGQAYDDFCQQKDDGILSPKAKFKYPIALKVIQQPLAGDVRVKATISWGVTHKDESEGRIVSAQPELPLKK